MPSKDILLTPIYINRTVTIEQGSGSPESAVTAAAGSIYLDETGKLWTKESGSGNTGWAEAGSGGGGSAAGSDTELQFNDSGSFGASANLTFDSGNSRLFATELRCGAADVFGNFAREATTGTGNNLDKLLIQASGTDAHIAMASEVKGLGSYRLYSTSYTRNQPGYLGIDIQLLTTASTQTASALYSTVVGNTNTASGNNSTAIGSANTASTTFTTAVGYATTASAIGATALGSGAEATASNSLALGNRSKARLAGMTSFASGRDTVVGDRQSGKLHLIVATTGTSTASATVGGGALSASNSLTLAEDMMVAGIATFLGYDGTDRYYERRRFVAHRASGGNVAVPTDVSEANANSLAFNACVTNIAVNTTYQCADFQIDGIAATNIEWLVTVEWTELAV